MSEIRSPFQPPKPWTFPDSARFDREHIHGMVQIARNATEHGRIYVRADLYDAATEELERLRTENAALREDAERFRWWFDRPLPHGKVEEVRCHLEDQRGRFNTHRPYLGDEWRAAIDHARGKA